MLKSKLMFRYYSWNYLKHSFSNQEENVKHINNANSIDISIVVPAYNESQRLPIMLQETTVFMKKFAAARKITYEVKRNFVLLCYCVMLFNNR